MNDAPTQSLVEPVHGACELGTVRVDSYSLELEDREGLVGDQASQTAFRTVLARWRERVQAAGSDPLGPTPIEEMSKAELDRIVKEANTDAARTVAAAIDEFAQRLAYVITRFLRHEAWKGVERIVVGGGFKESDVGRIAVRQAALRLQAEDIDVGLRILHHEADDGGLLGWAALAPSPEGVNRRALLAVDIGGTNVRCGIVAFDDNDVTRPRVIKREKWRHADDQAQDPDLVEGVVAMLKRLSAHAKQHGIPLAPFIGVACPGVIRADGSIARGAQNLPRDWQEASFHLPRRLRENIPRIGDGEVRVLMHNDAVVQGLSERTAMHDVQRWAVMTIGTGLGNASFTNRHCP